MADENSSGGYVISTRKVVGLVVVLTVLVVGGQFGQHWWQHGRFIQSTNNAYVQSEITPVSPKVAGYVSELLIADHQKVAKGDVLLRIEDQEYREQVLATEAELDLIVAEFTSIKERQVLQAHLVSQAEADIQIALAELGRARSDLTRAERLSRTGNTTKQSYDSSLAGFGQAEGMLSRAQAHLAATTAQISILDAEAEKLKAQQRRTDAELNILKIQVSHTIIKAPISGIVGNRAVRVGQLVEPGRFLMAIVPLENVWIEANFKETQLANVEVGQQVEIKVDTYKGTPIRGVVASVSPASGAEFSILPPQNATGNFTKIVQRIPVRIEIEPGHPMIGHLRSGMSTTVSINTKSDLSENVLVNKVR